MLTSRRGPASKRERPAWLPPNAGGLPRSRRRAALLACVTVLPALTGALLGVRGKLGLDSVLLIYLLAVVLVAVIGGLGPAVLAAVESFLLANWFLTPPYYTFQIAGRDRVVQLLAFVMIAVLVSITVDLGARHRVSAERNRMEARLLASLTSSDIGASAPEEVLRQIQDLFELDGVELVEFAHHADPIEGSVPTRLLCVGTLGVENPTLSVTTDSDLVLRGYGEQRFAENSRLLQTLAETAARSWQEQRLASQAAQAAQLAETDRIRAALLAAVGHDLRTPLAGIKASVSSLRQQDVPWTQEQQAQLLASIEDSTDRLTELVANLLAMSRIQTGAVSVHLAPVALDEVVGRALLHTTRHTTELHLPEDLPLVLADAGLLERVVANLLDNALRFSPPDQPVVLCGRTAEEGHRVELHIVDHGPGVAADLRERMFTPFQRLSDRDNQTGVGLGLAIARGFTEAMHASLEPTETAGGGLTMRLSLPAAA